MRNLICCLFVFVAATFTMRSQTVDTAILGTVTDSGGAVIPKATITITQPASGLTHTAVTGNEGTYEVRYLVPGEYSVEAQATGFRSERHTGINIQIGQQARIDFSLAVGTVQQTLEVQSAAPLLQTENATIAGVVGQERIENMPLNGRRFTDLAVLTPGVMLYTPDLHSSSTDGAEIGGNGGRLIWGQVNVDGVTMVNNRHNYVNLFPSVDAIQEFKVQTGDYSAEYGGNAGTNVNIQIKSGANQYHGDAFEFLRNTGLDARNYFIPSPIPQNILKQNQFGATFGGPIVHDKTFFFTSYEGIRSISQSPSTAIVLTPAQRMGDFSADGTTVIDPLSGQPFPNNVIPASRLDKVSTNIINQYMPLPNTAGVVNYAGASEGNLTVHQGIVRVDQYFSQKDQFFAHYIYGHRDFPVTDLNPNFHFTGNYPMHNFQAQYIHSFSPTLLNELRGGFDLENDMRIPARSTTNFFPAIWEDKELISHNPLRRHRSFRNAPLHPCFHTSRNSYIMRSYTHNRHDAERQWVGASNGVRAVRDLYGSGVFGSGGDLWASKVPRQPRPTEAMKCGSQVTVNDSTPITESLASRLRATCRRRIAAAL